MGKKILKRTEVIEISNRWFCAARISEILELIDIFQTNRNHCKRG